MCPKARPWIRCRRHRYTTSWIGSIIGRERAWHFKRHMKSYARKQEFNLNIAKLRLQVESALPYLHRSVVSHLKKYTDDLLDILDKYSDIDIEKFRRVLDPYHPQLADLFIKSVKEVSAQHFSQPIMNVVAMLPKEQLAEMAESLVSLTALKRRVSSQEGNCGWSTRMWALITKGDGLIWIKRKHYFAPELNPSYFARISYRRIRDEQDIKRVEDGAEAQGEAPLG